MKARIALCLLFGGVTALVFYRVRGLFPQHAVLVGLAVAALAYSLLRVVDNLRAACGHGSPRNQKKSQDQ